MPVKDILIEFYKTCIRPVLEYASTVFHYCQKNYLYEDTKEFKEEHFKLSSTI